MVGCKLAFYLNVVGLDVAVHWEPSRIIMALHKQVAWRQEGIGWGTYCDRSAVELQNVLL